MKLVGILIVFVCLNALTIYADEIVRVKKELSKIDAAYFKSQLMKQIREEQERIYEKHIEQRERRDKIVKEIPINDYNKKFREYNVKLREINDKRHEANMKKREYNVEVREKKIQKKMTKKNGKGIAGKCPGKQVYNVIRKKCVCRVHKKCADAGAKFNKITCEWSYPRK